MQKIMITPYLIQGIVDNGSFREKLPLPQEKIQVVSHFILYPIEQTKTQSLSASFQTMLASEDILRRDWEQPEEDEAWKNL